MPQLDVGTLKAAVMVDTTQLKTAKREIKGLGLDIKKSFTNVNRSLRNSALIATAAISLPLAMFATNSVKAASDAVEMTNVFNVAFQGIRQESEKTANQLAGDFDLASSTSKKLLGDVGDLMIGFGLTDKAALSLANRTLRIAGDLTSFRNIAGGIPAVTNAIFRGMLGISQALKPLGVAMNQRSKQFRSQIREMMVTRGITEQIARAELVLQEVIKQSVNAVDDYNRTRGELANTSRRLGEMMKFMREEFGKILIQGLRLDVIIRVLGTGMRILAKTLSIIPGFLRPVIGGIVLLGIVIPPVVVVIAIFNLAVLHLQKNSIGLTRALKLQTFFLKRFFMPSVIKATAKLKAFSLMANTTKFSMISLKRAGVLTGLMFAGLGKWIAIAGKALIAFVSGATASLLAALAFSAGSVVWAFKRIKASIPASDIKFLTDLMITLNTVLKTTWNIVKAIGKTVVEVVKLAIDSMTNLLKNMIFNLNPLNVIRAIKGGNIGAINPFGGAGDIFATFDKNMKKIAADLVFPKVPKPPGAADAAGVGEGVGIGATIPSLSSAAIRGTSEAVKIENQRSQNKKVENNTKNTANNTASMAEAFTNNSIVLMPANLTA